MFTIKLVTDLPEQLRKAADRLDTEMAGLLQEVGTYVLQEQRTSFEDKSRGGSGADGVKWKPLAESTERAKYRKGQRKPRKRADGTRPRRQTPVGPVPRSQVGVDTGLLRNCITPGFAASDGDGGSPLRVEGAKVVLEYHRSYAKYFDEERPLFPDDNNPPQSWVDGIEKIVREWVDEQLKNIN